VAGRFPERILDAVGACTRTLAGRPDADASLTQTSAGSLGSLRAVADRLAIRLRNHEPAIHDRYRPGADAAGRIFDALEQARLDALGARWLTGVSKNLLAHPGSSRDGIRWLAFEHLTGVGAPPAKARLAREARTALPPPLLDSLPRLALDNNSQETFAPAAARWSQDAAVFVTPAHPEPETGLPVGTTSRRALPKRGDPGAASVPLRKRPGSTHAGDDSSAPGAGVSSGTAWTGYTVFTTVHDRVTDAATLATHDEFDELQRKLAAQLAAARPMIARLAKKLLRVLLAQQVRHWRFDLDEGVVDASRLGAFIAGGGRVRPFKQESESPFPATCVGILIDHSGSMRGRPMLIAALTVEIFARVLERCGVRCEVLGFTTRDWDGGEPAREWAAKGYPDSPGRLNALEHIVLKEADVPWRRARAALGLVLRDDMLKENIDGEAVIWAHNRLRARSEPRRILVVVSDGTPMDEATLAANGHEYLERHLQSVVTAVETRSPVRIAAIGIGHDVSLFYSHATRLVRIDDLGPALSSTLIRLFTSAGP
jgi:cobaltochelatase CobT